MHNRLNTSYATRTGALLVFVTASIRKRSQYAGRIWSLKKLRRGLAKLMDLLHIGLAEIRVLLTFQVDRAFIRQVVIDIAVLLRWLSALLEPPYKINPMM